MYLYGMRLRGFSIGCQPMDGLIERYDDNSGKYHDILAYDRPLTEDEITAYELDFICSANMPLPVQAEFDGCF